MVRDGRKWKQAARSRSDLLSRLATYANPDGTFASEDGKKNFSPSPKKLQRHYPRKTLYRLSNDLRQLGLLSWDREKKHYGRRTYQINFQSQEGAEPEQDQGSDSPEEQGSYSPEQGSDSQITGVMVGPVVTNNRGHGGTCYQGSHSPESKQNTGIADSSSTSVRLLEPLPSSSPGRSNGLSQDHSIVESSSGTTLDDLKRSFLSKCQDPYGTIAAIVEIICERAEKSGTAIQTEAYIAKAAERFDTENDGPDREALQQFKRRRSLPQDKFKTAPL